MHDYLFNTEVVRLAFVVGIIISMRQYERSHLTTGSIVVPGYLAVASLQPLILIATLLNAGIAYWVVNKLLPRWFLLYGRTKFTVLATTSIVIQIAMLRLSPSDAYLWESDMPLFVGVGYVIPALIAHDMARQGVKKTMKSVGRAALIVAVPLWIAMGFVLPELKASDILTGAAASLLVPAWIPVAIVLSAITSWALLHNYGLRAGGFVGAAYIGAFSGDPTQIGLLVGVGLATYYIVTKLLAPVMILFGRRKFATMLIVASLTSWAAITLGAELFGWGLRDYLTVSALGLVPLFVPGLVANDMERSNPLNVLTGVTIAALFVVPLTLSMQRVDLGAPFDSALGLLLVGASSGFVVFQPQLRRGGRWIAVLVPRLLGLELGDAAAAARVGGNHRARRRTMKPGRHRAGRPRVVFSFSAFSG